MSKKVQLRRGTTAETSTFTGAVGEVTVDTDSKVPVVHDGVTAGGFPTAARANNDGTISLIKKDGTSAGVINSTGLFNDTLTSTNTNQALTASQGKVLKDIVDELTNTNTIENAEKLTTATGSAPSYSARAWVNFSVNSVGYMTIKGQGNVASVTSNAIGDYTIKFTTPMPDANYAVSLGGIGSETSKEVLVIKSTDNDGSPISKTAQALRVINTIVGGTTLSNAADASVVIYR